MCPTSTNQPCRVSKTQRSHQWLHSMSATISKRPARSRAAHRRKTILGHSARKLERPRKCSLRLGNPVSCNEDEEWLFVLLAHSSDTDRSLLTAGTTLQSNHKYMRGAADTLHSMCACRCHPRTRCKECLPWNVICKTHQQTRTRHTLHTCFDSFHGHSALDQA